MANKANSEGLVNVVCKFDVYNQIKYHLTDKQKCKIKSSKNSFMFGKLIFKIFQNFVDFHDIKISHALGRNPNLAVIPSHFSLKDNQQTG